MVHPESQIHGTEVCRVEIYQQCGYLANNTLYSGIMPATLDALQRRCQHQSRNKIEQHGKGLPYSQVTLFKTDSWNWTPVKPDHKQNSWSMGLNYFQYYDRSRIHYPDLRSVYRYDTSVLSSAIFVDAVVYTKHIIRYNWARLAGTEMSANRLFELASEYVLGDLRPMLNGLYRAEVEFYQTDEERKIGYIAHGRVKLTAPASNRVWVVDIECYRENFDSTVDNITY